ncbi:hypothetical protein G9A89_023060 [Geosiphon pyriformis]|nr:hypothetical protein G9A89_023060 [Geosiphon pyriformis]
MSTWEQPPAQNPAESASLLIKGTTILQSIGTSDKGKQPALTSGKHLNTRTPISLNVTMDGNTKTPIGKIDNFSFKINGIQISTKILVMEATQYQALVENDWLSKANATLN